jgi:hypothetical protein
MLAGVLWCGLPLAMLIVSVNTGVHAPAIAGVGCGRQAVEGCVAGMGRRDRIHVFKLRGGCDEEMKPPEHATTPQEPAGCSTLVGGSVWGDAVEEVEFEHEPTSTDDWSTREWGEAAWAHFTTEEQLDNVSDSAMLHPCSLAQTSSAALSTDACLMIWHSLITQRAIQGT